ncbi:MAG: hypothetical protein JJT99_09235 [Rhodobacteraceae bacterium]|nr:hypothetical protein [Paracoccaceae bacterium]
MSGFVISDMSDAAAAALMEGQTPPEQLPLMLAARWPDAPALQLGLAIALACDAIETMYVQRGALADRVNQGWRQAALIGAEVYALQLRLGADVRARDLARLWQDDQQPGTVAGSGI